MFDRRAVWILCSSIGLFALSLALPALAVYDKPLFGGSPSPKEFTGVVCLAMGWVFLPGWVGNPLWVAATICHGLQRHRIAIVLLSIGIASALLAPFLIELDKDLFELRYLMPGYYVWVASMVVMLIGATRSALRDVDRRLAIQRPF